jgi:hypothetical protein
MFLQDENKMIFYPKKIKVKKSIFIFFPFSNRSKRQNRLGSVNSVIASSIIMF